MSIFMQWPSPAVAATASRDANGDSASISESNKDSRLRLNMRLSIRHVRVHANRDPGAAEKFIGAGLDLEATPAPALPLRKLMGL